MAKQCSKSVDYTSKKYFERNDVFAEIVNYLFFAGKPVIDPDNLRTSDRVEEYQSLFSHFRRERDVFKCVCKENGDCAFMLIGIESQSYIDHSMVVRSLFNDAITLMIQVDKKARPRADAETHFLSKLQKGEKLIPVVTIVVYLGEKTWDAPQELHELFEEIPAEIVPFLPHYRLNLFCPRTMNEEDLEKFHSHIKATMGYLRYAEDKAKLEEFVLSEPAFENFPYDAAEFIQTVVAASIDFSKNQNQDGSVNMCKALIEMQKDARDEGFRVGENLGEKRGLEKGLEKGRTEGLKEGLEKGRTEGLKEGLEKGRESMLLESIETLMQTLKTSVIEAMRLLRIPEENFEYYSKHPPMSVVK